jgi:hypothetical protein
VEDGPQAAVKQVSPHRAQHVGEITQRLEIDRLGADPFLLNRHRESFKFARNAVRSQRTDHHQAPWQMSHALRPAANIPNPTSCELAIAANVHLRQQRTLKGAIKIERDGFLSMLQHFPDFFDA